MIGRLILCLALATYCTGGWISRSGGCGKSKYNDPGRNQSDAARHVIQKGPHIVNGWDARQGEYPWQAMFTRFRSLSCGAVLIDQNWFLTAAHCVQPGGSTDGMQLVIGAHERTGSGGDRQDIDVEGGFYHADHNADGELEDDVAVLKVARPISFKDNIKPACKPSGSYENRWGVTSGWGRTSDGGPLANTLQYATNPVMSHEDCHACYPNPTDIYVGMTCFGVCGQNTQSTCNGDSGGPLVVQQADNLHDVIGVTSFGMGGCLSQYPPVFGNISTYINWLDNAMNTPITVGEILAMDPAANATVRPPTMALPEANPKKFYI